MVEEEEEDDETEPAGPRGPKQRYMRPHRELSEDVARFVTCRRVPSYQNFNRSQQEVFDNVSAVMGEGREYEARKRNWEQELQAQLQAHWDVEEAHQAKMEKFMEEQQLFQALQRSQMEQMEQQRQQEVARKRVREEDQDRRRIEHNTREDRRWSTMYISNELAINNAKVLHDQEWHQRD
ncbi:hypothetical protein HanPI659440_Chr10g0375821 [Helianthus annuus]|nr:hypothetical protein HanPI659440_Chr10g0375821 [Helianthus annuus]